MKVKTSTGIAIILAMTFIGPMLTPSYTPAAQVLDGTCRTDWTQCLDNDEMANNYEGWNNARVACRLRANAVAKYGTPKWPSGAFSTFSTGTSYSAGVAVLIEKNAHFQNMFGVMTRSRVECEYDLNSKTVRNVEVS